MDSALTPQQFKNTIKVDLCPKCYVEQFNYTFLKQASIIVWDVLIFDSTIYEP